jgi:hypothetical protein
VAAPQVDSDTTVRVERVHPVKHFSPTRNAYVRHNKAKSDVSTAMPFDRSLVVAHSSCAANADCIDLDPVSALLESLCPRAQLFFFDWIAPIGC